MAVDIGRTAVTTLHLVRHGQSEWNLSRRLQGQVAHVPLTPMGMDQARAAARVLAGREIAALHSSDLLRARQTAEVIGTALGRPVHLDQGLREQAYGVLEGRPSADVLAAAPYDFADPDARAPGGESIRDVHDRVGRCLDRYLRRYVGRECVLVSHGDAIRIGLAWLAGRGPADVPWHEAANGSVTTVRLPPGRRRRPIAVEPAPPPLP
jgi:broad specificity phosphatase PhoE